MRFDSRKLNPYTLSSQKIISTANGDQVPIIVEGSIYLSDTLNLDSVLMVPSLDYNLLSVAQITIALNCIVIFWHSYFVFKDFQMRRKLIMALGKANCTI